MCQKDDTWLHIYSCSPIPFHRKYLCLCHPQVNLEDCDVIPDAGTSMWTARIISIIVKNMQSYIVAVVWGVAEVSFFLRKSKVDKNSTRKKSAPIKGESSLISAASVAAEN